MSNWCVLAMSRALVTISSTGPARRRRRARERRPALLAPATGAGAAVSGARRGAEGRRGATAGVDVGQGLLRPGGGRQHRPKSKRRARRKSLRHGGPRPLVSGNSPRPTPTFMVAALFPTNFVKAHFQKIPRDLRPMLPRQAGSSGSHASSTAPRGAPARSDRVPPQRADALAHPPQVPGPRATGLKSRAVVGDPDAQRSPGADAIAQETSMRTWPAPEWRSALVRPFLRDAIGGERGRFVRARDRRRRAPTATGDGCRASWAASAASAPGKARILQRGGSQPGQDAAIDLLQGGDLRVDAGAVGLDPAEPAAAPQSPDAGANGEEKWPDLVVQVAGDVAALILLHIDHAPQQAMIFAVEPSEARRQGVDALGDGVELGRAAARNAQDSIAAFQARQALGQRGHRRQRVRDHDQGRGRRTPTRPGEPPSVKATISSQISAISSAGFAAISSAPLSRRTSRSA